MNRKVYLSIFAVLFAFMALLACSDNATDPTKTEGDPNDANYLQAKVMTETYVDSLLHIFDAASGYISFDGSGPLSTTGDTLSIIFDSETCWWEIYVGSDSTGYSAVFIDSVKFQDALGCQMFPDSTTTTSIEYKMDFSLTAEDDSGYINLVFAQDVLLAGIQSEQVVLNSNGGAEFGLGFVLGDNMMSFSYAFTGEVRDIIFDRDELMADSTAHPLSGESDLYVSVSSVNQNGSTEINWNMIATFFIDHYHVYAESGDNYWEWDVYYDPPVM